MKYETRLDCEVKQIDSRTLTVKIPYYRPSPNCCKPMVITFGSNPKQYGLRQHVVVFWSQQMSEAEAPGHPKQNSTIHIGPGTQVPCRPHRIARTVLTQCGK